MQTRIRVLYLTHHGPWPPRSGGRLRDAALVPELARLADVEVWAVSRTAELDREWLHRRPAGTVVRVFPDEGPRRNYPTRQSAAASAELRRRMHGPTAFDVVHAEGHYLFHLVPNEARSRAVVVEHNVESNLLRQRLVHRGLTAASAADLEAVATAEEQVWRQVPLILTLSQEDRARILHRVPDARVCVSTNGADHIPLAAAERRSPIREPLKPRLGFLANYAYPPNRDALRWLLDDIMPAVRRRIPGAWLVLAGSGLREALGGRPLPTGVEALGWVENLSNFWTGIDIALCPLRIGGGIKVKTVEAIRSGAPLVSTAIGLEGLPPAAREGVVRADCVDEFVDAVVQVSMGSFRSRGHLASLANAQRALPTWRDVASSLHQHWLSVRETFTGGVRAR